MTDILPRSVDELTNAWLADVVRGAELADPDVRVVSYTVTPIAEGFGQTSDTFRIHLMLDGAPGALSMVAKFATKVARRRQASVATDLFVREINFYRNIAPRIEARTPACYRAEIDGSGEYFALLMEDLADHRPGDEVMGCDPADARLAVVEIAKLHAAFWGCPESAGVEPPRTLVGRLAEGWKIMVDTFGDFMPREIPTIRDRYLDSAEALHSWITTGETTVIHGDFRLDNLMFGPATGSPELIVLDWQAVRASRGMQDFAYLVSHCMSVEDRRRSEEELLDHYVDELQARGVDYTRDQAKIDYVLAMLYLVQYVVWITGINTNPHERAIRRKQALVDRAFTALVDHDAFSLLPLAF